MIELAEPYATRPVHYLQLSERDGWRLKVYPIAYGGADVDGTLVDAALAVGHARLPTPATTADRYGVGLLGVHLGRSLNVVFVDWWALENELHPHGPDLDSSLAAQLNEPV